MRNLIGLVSGLLFGVGLALSGMMDPARVRGFLDVAGNWDPTLAFVMGGAVVVMGIAWLIQRRMHSPAACEEFSLPGTRLIDARLIGGGALFGVGWGLGGLCPGPAIASVLFHPLAAGTFVLAMLAGMVAFRIFETMRS